MRSCPGSIPLFHDLFLEYLWRISGFMYVLQNKALSFYCSCSQNIRKCFLVNVNYYGTCIPIWPMANSLPSMVNVRSEIIFLNVVSFLFSLMKYIRCSSNWCLYGVHFDDQRPEAVSLWPEFLQWTCQQILGLCICSKQSTWTGWVSSLLSFSPPRSLHTII